MVKEAITLENFTYYILQSEQPIVVAKGDVQLDTGKIWT